MGITLAAALPFVYSYLSESININFIGTWKNQYEFYIENNSPFDRVIERFKIGAPKQELIFITTKGVYATKTPNGLVLPGGNMGYVPAAESHDIDGKVVRSKSKEKIIIPPLINNSWAEPVAMVANITITSKPKNYFLNKIEQFLSFIHIKDSVFYQRYVIVDNYWQTTETDNPEEALKIVCRNDNNFDKICEKYT